MRFISTGRIGCDSVTVRPLSNPQIQLQRVIGVLLDGDGRKHVAAPFRWHADVVAAKRSMPPCSIELQKSRLSFCYSQNFYLSNLWARFPTCPEKHDSRRVLPRTACLMQLHNWNQIPNGHSNLQNRLELGFGIVLCFGS